MDEIIFRWANSIVAQSSQLFFRSLDSAEFSWFIAATGLVGMWFAGKSNTQTVYIQHLGRAIKDRSVIRAHVLVMFGCMVASFVFARGLQHFFPRQRPMAVAQMQIPIDPVIWEQIKASISTQGSFPSDHAVMWFVMATGLLWLNRFVGITALMFGVIMSITRIGTGFHWASDIICGAALGILVTISAFWLLSKVKILEHLVNRLVGVFDSYPVIAYVLGFLIVMDFSRKFSGLFGLLATLLGKSISH